jgi:hypothetical protein
VRVAHRHATNAVGVASGRSATATPSAASPGGAS